MEKNALEKPPVALPVRRGLMAAAIAYLLGIFLASIAALPAKHLIVLCALSSAWAVFRLTQRKRVLLHLLVFMLLLGNLRAGNALRRRDPPTASGVTIEGTVKRIVKPYRVMLTGVTVDGEDAASRPVVVTLMREDGVPPDEAQVGQRVRGVGRLFAPEEPRNPGGMNWRIRAITDGYELSGYLLPGWTARGEARVSLNEAMRRLRLRIAARMETLYGEQAALFGAVMLGDKSGLDSETAAAMRLTGIAHILTVSGLHLSMIAGVVSRLLSRVSAGRKARFAVLSVFLAFFTALTGAAPGTIRACVMAMLREYAAMHGRRYEPLTALACAALLMTLFVPLWALSASFQFSFFVVLGIQLISYGLAGLARGRAGRLTGMTALCVSAQVASVPMQLTLYGYLPVWSLPMNLLCSALMPVFLLGGWCATLLGMLWPTPGAWIARMLAHAATGLERLCLWAASLEHAIVRLPAPGGAGVLLFAALLMLLSPRILLGRFRRQAAVLMAALMLLLYLPRLHPQARYMQVDVGQGDAALLADGRRAILVDVGPADSYEMLRVLRHEGLFVEAVILSHLDEDHAGALAVLLDSEVEIPAVIVSTRAAMDEPTQAVRDALERVEAGGIALRTVKRGDRITACGATIDVLSPDDTLSGSNECSLLLHARLEDVTFLLTGDLTQDSEPKAIPRVDVLKVAHHGSGNSTSGVFLAQAAPELALISVGANNRYGHPSERVLSSLADAHVRVLRTDESGGITLWLKDGEYRAETFLPGQQVR